MRLGITVLYLVGVGMVLHFASSALTADADVSRDRPCWGRGCRGWPSAGVGKVLLLWVGLKILNYVASR